MKSRLYILLFLLLSASVVNAAPTAVVIPNNTYHASCAESPNLFVAYTGGCQGATSSEVCYGIWASQTNFNGFITFECNQSNEWVYKHNTGQSCSKAYDRYWYKETYFDYYTNYAFTGVAEEDQYIYTYTSSNYSTTTVAAWLNATYPCETEPPCEDPAGHPTAAEIAAGEAACYKTEFVDMYGRESWPDGCWEPGIECKSRYTSPSRVCGSADHQNDDYYLSYWVDRYECNAAGLRSWNCTINYSSQQSTGFPIATSYSLDWECGDVVDCDQARADCLAQCGGSWANVEMQMCTPENPRNSACECKEEDCTDQNNTCQVSCGSSANVEAYPCTNGVKMGPCECVDDGGDDGGLTCDAGDEVCEYLKKIQENTYNTNVNVLNLQEINRMMAGTMAKNELNTAAIKEDTARIAATLSDIEENTSQTSEGLAGIETNTSSIDGKMDGLQTELQGVNTELDAISTSATTIADAVAPLNENTNDIESKLHNIQTDTENLNAINNHLTDIDNATAVASMKLSDIASNTDGIGPDIDGIKTNTFNSSQSLNSIDQNFSGWMGPALSALDNTDNNTAVASQTLQTISDQIDALGDNDTLSDQEIGDLLSGLDGYGQTVSDNQSQSILDEFNRAVSEDQLPSDTLNPFRLAYESLIPDYQSSCIPIDFSFSSPTSIGNHTVDINLECHIADKIKLFIGWVLGYFTIIYIFDLVLAEARPNPGTSTTETTYSKHK